jgi:hypothetical protein
MAITDENKKRIDELSMWWTMGATTTKNYAERTHRSDLTTCGCHGKPPDDCGCEFMDEKSTNGLCFYYFKELDHCGHWKAQNGAKT